VPNVEKGFNNSNNVKESGALPFILADFIVSNNFFTSALILIVELEI
jgi:hypothetical protein